MPDLTGQQRRTVEPKNWTLELHEQSMREQHRHASEQCGHQKNCDCLVHRQDRLSIFRLSNSSPNQAPESATGCKKIEELVTKVECVPGLLPLDSGPFCGCLVCTVGCQRSAPPEASKPKTGIGVVRSHARCPPIDRREKHLSMGVRPIGEVQLFVETPLKFRGSPHPAQAWSQNHARRNRWHRLSSVTGISWAIPI